MQQSSPQQNFRQKSIRTSEAGFSLIEIMIVVAIIGIIAAITVVSLQAHQRAVREQLAVTKLNELAEGQMQFRVTLGRGRFGTLEELRAARTGTGPLLNPQLAPVDRNGNPLPVGGWIIRESRVANESPCFGCDEKPEDGAVNSALRSAYAVEAVPAEGNPSTNNYCIHEDGVVRRTSRIAEQCSRTSSPINE